MKTIVWFQLNIFVLTYYFLFFRGVCTQAPCYCIIMEYCPYGPLYNLLKDGEEIPPQRLVSWSKQIASGMHYLHSNKIIHRDLKSPKYVLRTILSHSLYNIYTMFVHR